MHYHPTDNILLWRYDLPAAYWHGELLNKALGKVIIKSKGVNVSL